MVGSSPESSASRFGRRVSITTNRHSRSAPSPGRSAREKSKATRAESHDTSRKGPPVPGKPKSPEETFLTTKSPRPSTPTDRSCESGTEALSHSLDRIYDLACSLLSPGQESGSKNDAKVSTPPGRVSSAETGSSKLSAVLYPDSTGSSRQIWSRYEDASVENAQLRSQLVSHRSRVEQLQNGRNRDRKRIRQLTSQVEKLQKSLRMRPQSLPESPGQAQVRDIAGRIHESIALTPEGCPERIFRGAGSSPALPTNRMERRSGTHDPKSSVVCSKISDPVHPRAQELSGAVPATDSRIRSGTPRSPHARRSLLDCQRRSRGPSQVGTGDPTIAKARPFERGSEENRAQHKYPVSDRGVQCGSPNGKERIFSLLHDDPMFLDLTAPLRVTYEREIHGLKQEVKRLRDTLKRQRRPLEANDPDGCGEGVSASLTQSFQTTELQLKSEMNKRIQAERTNNTLSEALLERRKHIERLEKELVMAREEISSLNIRRVEQSRRQSFDEGDPAVVERSDGDDREDANWGVFNPGVDTEDPESGDIISALFKRARNLLSNLLMQASGLDRKTLALKLINYVKNKGEVGVNHKEGSWAGAKQTPGDLQEPPICPYCQRDISLGYGMGDLVPAQIGDLHTSPPYELTPFLSDGADIRTSKADLSILYNALEAIFSQESRQVLQHFRELRAVLKEAKQLDTNSLPILFHITVSTLRYLAGNNAQAIPPEEYSNLRIELAESKLQLRASQEKLGRVMSGLKHSDSVLHLMENLQSECAGTKAGTNEQAENPQDFGVSPTAQEAVSLCTQGDGFGDGQGGLFEAHGRDIRSRTSMDFSRLPAEADDPGSSGAPSSPSGSSRVLLRTLPGQQEMPSESDLDITIGGLEARPGTAVVDPEEYEGLRCDSNTDVRGLASSSEHFGDKTQPRLVTSVMHAANDLTRPITPSDPVSDESDVRSIQASPNSPRGIGKPSTARLSASLVGELSASGGSPGITGSGVSGEFLSDDGNDEVQGTSQNLGSSAGRPFRRHGTLRVPSASYMTAERKGSEGNAACRSTVSPRPSAIVNSSVDHPITQNADDKQIFPRDLTGTRERAISSPGGSNCTSNSSGWIDDGSGLSPEALQVQDFAAVPVASGRSLRVVAITEPVFGTGHDHVRLDRLSCGLTQGGLPSGKKYRDARNKLSVVPLDPPEGVSAKDNAPSGARQEEGCVSRTPQGRRVWRRGKPPGGGGSRQL